MSISEAPIEVTFSFQSTLEEDSDCKIKNMSTFYMCLLYQRDVTFDNI